MIPNEDRLLADVSMLQDLMIYNHITFDLRIDIYIYMSNNWLFTFYYYIICFKLLRLVFTITFMSSIIIENTHIIDCWLFDAAIDGPQRAFQPDRKWRLARAHHVV